MTTAFLVFFVLYLLYALWDNLVRRAPEGKRLSTITTLLQVPLFALGTLIIIDEGVINRGLVFLPAIAVGIALGHIVFVMSLIATKARPRDAWEHLRHVGPVLDYLKNDPMTLFRIFGVSLSEEIIYRAAAQPVLTHLTGSPLLGILLTAIAFCLVHAHFFRNPWEQSAEFTAFALLLGALYFYTGNLTLVALVHAVRNWEIAYIEYALGQQAADEAVPAPARIVTNTFCIGKT